MASFCWFFQTIPSFSLPTHSLSIHSSTLTSLPSLLRPPLNSVLPHHPPNEPGKNIEMYLPQFYAHCTVVGILNSGGFRFWSTPFDVVKCNMQIDSAKDKNILFGFLVLLREQGYRGFLRGMAANLLGYSAYGACKFGFYEFFKKYYSDLAGPEYFAKYKALIQLARSVSAEVIADVALCPFEVVKVRVRTRPGFARGLSDGLPKLVKSECVLGYASQRC